MEVYWRNEIQTGPMQAQLIPFVVKRLLATQEKDDLGTEDRYDPIFPPYIPQSMPIDDTDLAVP